MMAAPNYMYSKTPLIWTSPKVGLPLIWTSFKPGLSLSLNFLVIEIVLAYLMRSCSETVYMV